MTDLNLLDVFVRVAEARSFTTAARRLGLQRSSVSRAIAALEDELGVQLFARTTRVVTLTSAGAALLARVRPSLASLHDAMGALAAREEAPSGVLTLTAPTDVAATFLPALVDAFVARHAAVSVRVAVTNAQTDLVAEGIDAAVRAVPAKRSDSSLVSKKLADIELQLFASPTYLAAHGAPRRVEDLRDHAWISFRSQPLAPPSSIPRDAHPRSAARVVADDMLFLRGAAVAGTGIAVLPSFTARDDVVAGRLVRVLPKLELARGALWLVHAPSQHVPKRVTAFRDFVVEALASQQLS